MIQGNQIQIDFSKDEFIKRILTGENNKMTEHQVITLAIMGRDFLIMKNIDDLNYLVLHRDYYAMLIYYFDRSNPCVLNISTK